MPMTYTTQEQPKQPKQPKPLTRLSASPTFHSPLTIAYSIPLACPSSIPLMLAISKGVLVLVRQLTWGDTLCEAPRH